MLLLQFIEGKEHQPASTIRHGAMRAQFQPR